MLSRFTRSRALTVGVSCLVHAGLIVLLLLAERFIMSAHAARPPVLPIEIVTLADAPPPEPVREQAPPPKPILKKILRLPKPVEPPPPPPQMIEAATEPRPEPTPPPVPAVNPPAPSAPAVSDPAPTQDARASGPVGAPLAVAPDGPSAPTGLPAGKTTGLPAGNATGPATPGPSTTVASIPGPKDAPTSGAITRYARPQGGYQVRPSYPSSARRLGIQGTTMLKVHVLNDGRVGDVLVEQSAGHPDLDQAATAAVRQWRFDPARRGDDPVAMWVLLPVEFRLR